MVSWDLKAKFYGVSPNVQELVLLAKQEGFSNIERLESNGDGTYTVIVNNRAMNQTKFEAIKQ